MALLPQGVQGRVHRPWAKLVAMTGQLLDHRRAVNGSFGSMMQHVDAHKRQVLPLLVQDEVGVLGMKALGDPFILQSSDRDAHRVLALRLAPADVHGDHGHRQHANPRPGACSRADFTPMSPEAVAGVLARTAQAAATGKYEPFKTSNRYDGTAKNPQWLG